MEALNYHHLRYFLVTAKEGSLRRASEVLRVSQPSMCAQIKQLEDTLGQKLFRKNGRGLALTEAGRAAYGIAGEIFGLGDALVAAVRREPKARAVRLQAGITDVLPKSVAHGLLRPAMGGGGLVRLLVREGMLEDLLGMLRAGRLDLVLANEPAPSGSGLQVVNHYLGDCGTTIMAAPDLARRLRKGFPKSLCRQPALLPSAHTPSRRQLEQWFRARRVEPEVVAEFDDPALMKLFAEDGAGFLPVPDLVVAETTRRHGLDVVGQVEEAREAFHAITPDKEALHPAAGLVIRAAAEWFATCSGTRRLPG